MAVLFGSVIGSLGAGVLPPGGLHKLKRCNLHVMQINVLLPLVVKTVAKAEWTYDGTKFVEIVNNSAK